MDYFLTMKRSIGKIFIVSVMVFLFGWLTSYGWHHFLYALLQDGGTTVYFSSEPWKQDFGCAVVLVLCLPLLLLMRGVIARLTQQDLKGKESFGALVAMLVGSQLGVLLRGVDMAKRMLRPITKDEIVQLPQIDLVALDLPRWAGAGAVSAVVLSFGILLAVAMINREAPSHGEV